MGFLIFLPFIGAIIGIMIGIICFMGVCLIAIGITGIAKNKIYSKQINTEKSISASWFNMSSIFLGIAFMLFPLGYFLAGVITELSTK